MNVFRKNRKFSAFSSTKNENGQNVSKFSKKNHCAQNSSAAGSTGRCTFGSQCFYAHNPEDIQEVCGLRCMRWLLVQLTVHLPARDYGTFGCPVFLTPAESISQPGGLDSMRSAAGCTAVCAAGCRERYRQHQSLQKHANKQTAEQKQNKTKLNKAKQS